MGSWRFNVPVLWDQVSSDRGLVNRIGITLPRLSLAAILRMLVSSTVMIYWHNFHRHGARDCRRGSRVMLKPDAVLRAIRRYLND